MAYRRSINASAGWHTVLPVLGIEAKPGLMPVQTDCPVCDGSQLRIYHSKPIGNWHYCPDCGSHGDMIELAAKTWKCSLPKAIRRLVREGVLPSESAQDEPIVHYYRGYPAVQDNYRKLFSTSQQQLHKGEVVVSTILHKLGLPRDQDKPYWPKRMGRFMGAVHFKTVYKLLWPRILKGILPGWHAKFAGGGWSDVLAIPLHDLPGRCTSMLFIGRDVSSIKDFEHIMLNPPPCLQPNKQEIGVAMYETMETPTAFPEIFKRTTFVFDVVHALKMQARHLRDSELPLPIVGSFTKRFRRRNNVIKCELVTTTMWRDCPDRDFVFWEPKASAHLFNMALHANGRVLISDKPADAGKMAPHRWLQWIDEHAVSWQRALEEQLRTLPENKSASLLKELDLASDALRAFRDSCGSDVQELIMRHRYDARSFRTANYDGHKIVETDAGWFLEDSDECISNTIVRIEKIVHVDGDDAYYQGKLIISGEEIEFSENMRVLDKHMHDWLRRKALAAGKVAMVRRLWASALVEIAQQMHTPTVVQEDGKFGWKLSELRFKLPRFSIYMGGRVDRSPSRVVDTYTPGQNLEPPDVLPPEITRLTKDTPANRVFWATAASIAANVAAPVLGENPIMTCWVGAQTALVGKIAALRLGCVDYFPTLNKKQAPLYASWSQMTIERHSWPVVLRDDMFQFKNIFGSWLNTQPSHNILIGVNEWQSPLISMLVPTRLIRANNSAMPGIELQLYGHLILPAWLQQFCKNKLQIQYDRSLATAVLNDLAMMLEPYGANSDFIRNCAENIDEVLRAEDRAARFVELIYRGIASGTLEFVRGSCTKRRSERSNKPVQIVHMDTDDRVPGIFIPYKAVDTLVTRHSLFVPDRIRITDALKAASALAQECVYNEMHGWRVHEPWWTRQIERFRVRYQHRLSVIGGTE